MREDAKYGTYMNSSLILTEIIDWKNLIDGIDRCANKLIQLELLKMIFEYEYDPYCKVFAAVAGITEKTFEIWFAEIDFNSIRSKKDKDGIW